MATLSHTPTTCTPLPSLGAEIYGDPSTPTPPTPVDRSTTDARWQEAVTQVAEQLRATLRVAALPERHHKALALVLAHAVTLHPDGTASVQSSKQTYRLAPECPCADATHRTEMCKHALDVELHRRALALLDGMAAAQARSTTHRPRGRPPGSDAQCPCRRPARGHAAWTHSGAPSGPPPQC